MRILYVLILITLHKLILCKKHRYTNSDESIENLVVYKDCRRKAEEIPQNETQPQKQTFMAQITRPAPPPQCPCPRVCCSLCCECVSGNNFQSQNSIMSQQIPPVQSPFQPWSGPPMDAAPEMPPKTPRRKKPLKFLPPPLGSRRDLSSAREHIKGLIAQDQDIKKILKDLVRVTMQKVDVIETIKARQPGRQVQIRKEETGNEQALEVTKESLEEDL